MSRTRPALAAVVVTLALTAAGCGGGSDEAAAPASSSPSPASATGSDTAAPSPSATPTTYLPVPAGVTLTDQGSALSVGQSATVAWQPRQDTVGVLDVTIDRLEKTTLEKSFTGWKIPPETETAAPYFVRATLVNRGETDLSGKAIPLYVVDATSTLIEATTFASTFKPCRDGVFPAGFGPGASAQVCLVYFAPDAGELTAVSFRPTQEFDPITWTGDVQQPGKQRGAKATATPTP